MSVFHIESKTVFNSHQDAVDAGFQTRHLVSAWNWDTAQDAQDTIDACGVADSHMVVDLGDHVRPRFDVIEIPKVGDDVSYAFNGDYYPDGQIAKISKTMKLITTTTGNKYYRKGNSGSWKRSNTWSLIRGHVSRLNMEF